MTYAQLKSFLQDQILRSDTTSANSTLVSAAINAGHKQLQMDGDFRCMETHATVTYTANSTYGVSVASNCKKIRNVYLSTGALVLPSTEDDVQNIRTLAVQARGLAAPDSSYANRWYEIESKFCLMTPPTASTSYRVDYYQFLPDYSLDADTDYFSQNLWLCLLMASAWLGSISLWEDDRAGMFQSNYSTLLQQAIENDKFIKQGGTIRTPRVPAPATIIAPVAPAQKL